MGRWFSLVERSHMFKKQRRASSIGLESIVREAPRNFQEKFGNSNLGRSTFFKMEKMNFIVNDKNEEVFIIDKPNLEFCTSNGRISASKGFIQQFNKEEVNILLYHELFHKYHDSKIFLLFLMGYMLLVYLTYLKISIFTIIVTLWLTLNISESSADIYASKKIGKNSYLPLLKKYSKLCERNTFLNIVKRQITHALHPTIRYWLIEKLG